jgi:hypothetical protein
MPLQPQTRRLLIAIAAWPAGILGAIAFVIVRALMTATPCEGGGPCVQELKPASSTSVLLWLALAFGPGIFATREWWKHRGGASDDDSR